MSPSLVTREEARRRFFVAAVNLFRRMDASNLPLFRVEVKSEEIDAWRAYQIILDREESEELVRPQWRPSRLEMLLHFLTFRRWDTRGRRHRKEIEKLLNKTTPPPGAGGPWG